MKELELNGKPERSSIFDRVNQLDAEMVIRDAHLTKAADGRSWICPDCGHGSHGDGIKPQWRGGILRWKCYSCGQYWSNSDLIACGNDVELDNAAAKARFLEKFYGNDIPFSLSEKSSGAGEGSLRAGANAEAVKVEKDWSKLYSWCNINHRLSEFLPIGTTWRGLTYTTLSGTRQKDYLAVKYHPELWLNDKQPAILFPYDKHGFFWRSTEGKARGFSPRMTIDRPYVAASVKVGWDAINFVVEGVIDALSVKQVLADKPLWLKYTGILAVGSAAYYRMFAEWVINNYGAAAVKPEFFVIADNDESGDYFARQVQYSLTEAGFKVVYGFFTRLGESKLDANDVLQQKGADALFGALAHWKKTFLKDIP